MSRLLALNSERTKAQEDEAQPDGGDNTLSGLPEAKVAEGDQEDLGKRESLREQIRKLALEAIANDPLNAKAFRLLAEVTGGNDQVRLLMQQSLERSKRESVAALWLLNDSFYHKDYKSALRYSDLLLRTRRELAGYVFSYLAFIAEAPEGRDLLIKILSSGPEWRRQFFEVLPSKSKSVDTPLALMTALQSSGDPISNWELAPYLRLLIATKRVELAYNAWLQFLPQPQLETLGLLTNASFQNTPSGLPFDWRIKNGVNAIAEIVPSGEGSAQQVLHISFSDGRVEFPEVSQIVVLGPGRYRLEGKLRGSILGKRGLRWQIHCAAGAQSVLAETDMLLGQSQQWRIFTLEAEVPQLEECRGQTLRLFHDSRSASEELLSGEVWFSDLRLERIPAVTGDWTIPATGPN